jgi:hypothetical protein
VKLTPMRRIAALFFLAGSAVIASPLGCAPPGPPEPPPLPNPPKPPEAPKPPDAIPEIKGGGCCFRNTGTAAKICPGQAHCCSGDFALDACESGGGLWFSTSEGCRGAC